MGVPPLPFKVDNLESPRPPPPSTSQRLAPGAAGQGGVVFKVMFPERDKVLWSTDESC